MKADPNRLGMRGTGIFVRAYLPSGKPATVDIIELDAASLLEWLRSRGGKNEWAENTVGLLLGHRQSLTAGELPDG